MHRDKATQLAAKTAALDVSLDPQSDPVVAITAKESNESEFSELIQCAVPIPSKITELTGIDQERLALCLANQADRCSASCRLDLPRAKWMSILLPCCYKLL